MKKSILFSYLTIVFCMGVNAQSAYLGNYAQPSPNAAALGKYVEYPVSYFTGVPEVGVLIYDLKDGAAHVPVSLSYHASGIRVSEVATSVGLGWCLNAGGMITRTIRGGPDEGAYNSSTQAFPRGYYLDSGLSKLPLLPHPVNDTITSDPSQFKTAWYTVPGIVAGTVDCEPDLFFFNFNGYTGKFVFDENRTPRLLTDDNLQISVGFDSTHNKFTTWVITTPDGAKYYFGENSMVETVSTTSSVSGPAFAVPPSSWYLTRAVYPNTKDTVYFNYAAEGAQYYDLGPESKLYNFFSGTSLNLATICNDNSAAQQSLIKTTTSGYRLSSIQSRNYTVSFIANTNRQDMPALFAAYSLDSVKIYAHGQCLKQYALAHGYFVSTSATTVSNLAWANNDTTDMRRLKLLSVQEFSGDGTILKPPYKFTYQETYKLPRRLSYDQDHWGFSNSSTGNTNPWFTPSVSFMACVATPGAGAVRDPKWPQMEAAALLSVKDPLGSLTNFTFEPDAADNYYPGRTIGGLRVQQIAVTDSVTGLTNVRSYRYAGGQIFRSPQYIIALANEFYVPATFSSVAGYQGYSWNPFSVGALKQSSSIVPMQDPQGNTIGYTSVTETFGATGQGGYKTYTFTNNTEPSNNSRLSINNYASTQGVYTGFYGLQTVFMGNGHFNDTAASVQPQNLQYFNQYNVDSYYPNTPYQVRFSNGKLQTEYTYDSAGNMISSVINTYTENLHENYKIRALKAYRTAKVTSQNGTPAQADQYMSIQEAEQAYDDGDFVESGSGNNSSISFSLPQYNDALSFYKLRTGISHLTSSVETLYKDGKQMVNTTTYGFESAYHTLQTGDTTVTSQGDSIIKKTYYSFDYANSATTDGVFTKMKARNLLVPVATRVWKNHQLISGTVTQYKDFAASAPDTLINPLKIYALDVSNPLTITQAGENIALTGQLPTLLPNTHFTEKADFNYDGTSGKITEQNLVYDKNQALVWDRQYNVPLAVVDNASPTDVAFSSFETAESGNWAITPASVVTDATAPTGTHAYTLSGTAVTKAVTNGKAYTVSYWLKSGASITISGASQTNIVTGSTLNGWTCHQLTLTASGTSVSITGSGSVDELRLYPATAQMVTYSYDVLMRLTDQCSANSTISQYEYDSFNRLVDIKDQHGYVVKAFQYNYGSNSR